jgi:hypothetical protein
VISVNVTQQVHSQNAQMDEIPERYETIEGVRGLQTLGLRRRKDSILRISES